MNAIHSEPANCRNCYKCLRACPVKSIHFSNGQAELQSDTCIYCGACIEACSQHAKVVTSYLDQVKALVAKEAVTVSLAPSFVSAFSLDDPRRMVTALKALGFARVEETAVGAAMVSDAYVRLAAEGRMDNILTTCCPSVNNLIEKHYPHLIGAMAPVVSPMIAHAKRIKEIEGAHTPVVFIGPCIAKLDEVSDLRHENDVAAALTFEDLIAWMQEKGIDPKSMAPTPFDGGVDAGLARQYPLEGGIVENVKARGIQGYELMQVRGVEECMEVLDAIGKGLLHNCFIEMNICPGACLGGPASGTKQPIRFAGIRKVADYAAGSAQPVPAIDTTVDLTMRFLNRKKQDKMPTEEEIRKILRSIGKERPEDELNCSSCGYPTCRAKAIAVYQGKAELSMCMPYMYQTAQSMAGVVLDNTPNYILVVDDQMKICEMNPIALKAFGLTRSEATNHYLFEYMDTGDIDFVMETHQSIIDKKVTLIDLKRTVLMTLVFLPKTNGVMAIMKDVTSEEEHEKALYRLRMDTIDMAQKVIEKQMVAAQEIASLLGETTAETKSTLTHLKNMIIEGGE